MTATTSAFRQASQTPLSRIRMVRPQYHFRSSPGGLLAWGVRRLIRIASGLPFARWPWHQSRNSMKTTGTRTELQRQHARASLSTARSFWRPICRSRSSLTREDGSWTECIVYAKHSWKEEVMYLPCSSSTTPTRTSSTDSLGPCRTRRSEPSEFAFRPGAVHQSNLRRVWRIAAQFRARPDPLRQAGQINRQAASSARTLSGTR